MIINCEWADLKPTNFDIVNFYGVETCFAWNNEKLVVFPYKFNDSTEKLRLIVAPKSIRSIHSYSGRVFVLFYPCGIYKFKQNHEFVVLSTSAIGICGNFYEVLKLKNNYITLINLCEKTSKQLFKCSELISDVKDINELCVSVIPLNVMSNIFKQILLLNNSTTLYIISHRRKLFKIHEDNTQLIYNCQQNIINVSAIKKKEEVVGLLLKTDSSAIIVGYAHNSKLCFKKINLNAPISSVIVEFLEENEIQVLYSDSEKVYYFKQKLNSETGHNITCSNERVIELKNYNGGILGLTKTSKLNIIDYNMERKLDAMDTDDFCELQSSMLKGTEVIVENICKQANELNVCNEKLLIEQDKLKRINIYMDKKRLPHLPKVLVNRTAGCLFLKLTFDYPLAPNTNIFLNLRSNNQTQFCSKLVDSREVTIEMILIPEMLESTLDLSIDMVTFSEKRQPWCLIRDCINKQSSRDRAKIQQLLKDKKNFLNAKLNTLLNITPDASCIDINEISNIRKSIRKQIPDL